jgi:hypothetical protein
MLDYYGSIALDKADIDAEIIKYFKSQMKQTSIVKMIEKYRKLEFIHPEYSVSGWYMFHGKTVVDHLQDAVNKESERTEQFLALIYCLEKKYNIPHDLYEIIYKKYKNLFINQLY